MIENSTNELAKLRSKIYDKSNSAGIINEQFFVNLLIRKPTLNNIHFTVVVPNLRKTISHIPLTDEFDITLRNDTLVVVVECKVKATIDDVKKLKNTKLSIFKTLWPELIGDRCKM